ncbi:MAG: long-chain fatty acid--CoA ligase [Bryobacterales bacterium]|nr:long-chain fatty acid--CoA ligase [Bryobacterales bacterium]
MGLRTVYTVLDEAAAKFGGALALHQPYSSAGKTRYRAWSWVEYRDAAREIACGLHRLGAVRGDIVALDSQTRAEFYLADIGIMAAGCVSAALYPSLPSVDLVQTLRSCNAKVVFAEDAKTMAALCDAGAGAMPLQWVLLTGDGEDAITLDQLRTLGRDALQADPEYFHRISSEIADADPAILYLTSGATGEPKMGLVSHCALTSNMAMGPKVLPVGPEDSALVFLPSAHIAQRVVLELVPIPLGLPVWFSESLNKLPHELKTIRPTLFLAPPRVWERMYSTLYTELRKRPALVRKLFYGAVGLGLEAAKCRQQGRPLPGWMRAPLKLADALVFRNVRKRWGGRLRVAASGAAPLSKDLALFYAAIGMPLIEGYGLTEGGIVSVNPTDRPRPGSIGKALPGVEVMIADDGELLVRSPSLFLGYYNDPQATAEVLRDGWLHTGDLGEIGPDDYIRITGRKKELIVSSSGKKIFPSHIESLFKVEPIVSHVFPIGDRMPYVTALLTINPAVAAALPGGDTAGAVFAEVRKVIARVNRQLASFERIRKFRILDRDFSIEHGELTPTMKLRRGRVIENFRALIDELYGAKAEFAE